MTSEERNLEGEQKEEGLDTVEASVNKVSHEKVVGVWHISPNLETNNQEFQGFFKSP